MPNLISQFNEQELKELVSDALKEQISGLLINTPKPQKSNEEELLSIDQVCKIFGVSRTTILDWRKKGLLESLTLNRRVFFLKNRLFENLQNKNRILGEEL